MRDQDLKKNASLSPSLPPWSSQGAKFDFQWALKLLHWSRSFKAIELSNPYRNLQTHGINEVCDGLPHFRSLCMLYKGWPSKNLLSCGKQTRQRWQAIRDLDSNRHFSGFYQPSQCLQSCFHVHLDSCDKNMKPSSFLWKTTWIYHQLSSTNNFHFFHSWFCRKITEFNAVPSFFLIRIASIAGSIHIFWQAQLGIEHGLWKIKFP